MNDWAVRLDQFSPASPFFNPAQMT